MRTQALNQMIPFCQFLIYFLLNSSTLTLAVYWIFTLEAVEVLICQMWTEIPFYSPTIASVSIFYMGRRWSMLFAQTFILQLYKNQEFCRLVKLTVQIILLMMTFHPCFELIWLTMRLTYIHTKPHLDGWELILNLLILKRSCSFTRWNSKTLTL